MVMGEGHNDDNDATEMTTVIMINKIVTDHDNDDDDDGVGEGVIHDCDGGDDGQEEEKDGSLDHDKSHARTQDVMYMFFTVNVHTCGSWAIAVQHSSSNQTTRSHLASHTTFSILPKK